MQSSGINLVFHEHFCAKLGLDILIHAKQVIRIPIFLDFYEPIPDLGRIGIFDPLLALLTDKVYVNSLGKLLGGAVNCLGPAQAPFII